MLKTVYENYLNPAHPTAYSGIGNVKRFYGNLYSRKDIEATLAHADGYTLHREYKSPAVRNAYFVYSPREQAQLDLIDMQQLAKHNDGVRFLSVLIDAYTRKLWIKTLKDKTQESSLAAIKEFVEEIKPKIRTMLFDKGTEYTNNMVRTYLKKEDIKVIHPFSEIKAGLVERANRSIQSLIYMYMTEQETFRYVDALDDLVSSYNNRGHRTLQYLTPNEAELPENAGKVMCALNTHYSKAINARKEPKLTVGQTVRVAKLKDKMTRGYQERFNLEHYKIVEVLTRMPVEMYRLRSMDTGEIIQGGFYKNELQVIDGDVFKIERVLKSRVKSGRQEILVKWKGFSEKHNSWEPRSNVTKDYEQQNKQRQQDKQQQQQHQQNE